MEGEHTMNKFGKVQQAVLVLMLALFGSGASAQEDWVASVAQRSHSAVVTVVSYDGDNRQLSLGSGFVIREDGLIVTNYHVIKSASAVEVANPSIGKYRVRGVVAFNRDLDFAVLKIQADDLTALPLGNSTQVRLGESIVAIGNPKGLSGTVSAGLISQFREESSYRMLQISAPIYPGNNHHR
ncbi:MAG: serine protease [Acidobacteria bacterium]|nr:serine protease [Acidobacteriota bacterium]